MSGLLFQIDTLREASRSFREYSQSHGPGTVFLFLFLGALLVALILYTVFSGRDRMVGRRLFLRLCRASRLEKAELALFREVARRGTPDNPSSLFLRRSLFEGTLADMPVPDPGVVAAVRQKVYGP